MERPSIVWNGPAPATEIHLDLLVGHGGEPGPTRVQVRLDLLRADELVGTLQLAADEMRRGLTALAVCRACSRCCLDGALLAGWARCTECGATACCGICVEIIDHKERQSDCPDDHRWVGVAERLVYRCLPQT